MKRLGVVGATGLVGMSVLNLLQEKNMILDYELFLFVSDKSEGKVLVMGDKHYTLLGVSDFKKYKLDYAIFLTDEKVSLFWAEKFAKSGVRVIDNSSAFRLKKGIPLVVPEINGNEISKDNNIISNPNCSTIQLVVVLDRLLKLAEIKRVIVSSYQSVSGAGRDALHDLETCSNNYFEQDIRKNFIAKIGDIQENGNCKEENKIINETKKILHAGFEVFATTVRVPISYCHGESVFVEFENDVTEEDVEKILNCDYIKTGELFYPSACAGTDQTYVCRLRKNAKNTLEFFVIADNLRRGAAYNAIKILEIIEKY